MFREANTPARTTPHFPAETAPWTHQAILPGTGYPRYQPTNPAVETERKCPPGSICSPHVLDGHTKIHHHRLTDSVPAIREGIIPGGTSWLHPLPASRDPTMSLWTTLATGTGIRDSTSGHPTVLSEISLNNV